ncbi:MAG: hypothetical protein ACE5IB_04290 [Candidatus Geothermarchaeales archaeon]
MKSYSVLFVVGFALLIVGVIASSILYSTLSSELLEQMMSQLEEKLGSLGLILGELAWILPILGIVLTGIGYWKKTDKG